MFQQRFTVFSTGLLAGLTGAAGILYERKRKQPELFIDAVQNQDKSHLYKYGKPDSSVSIHEYKSHTLAYDRSKKIPLWVMEVMSGRGKEEGKANRRHSVFKPDPALPAQFTATNKDYWRSGWSRGHMAAAGNYQHCQESMDDTFYLTNVVPQNMNNNESYWYRLENYCRGLGKHYDEVRVISGPLFLPVKEGDRKLVNYPVLGSNEVCVPTHLYKIIIAENERGKPLLGVFVVPNEPIEDKPLSQFNVQLEDVEKWTGTKFLQFLQRHECLDLCETDGCQIMGYDKYLQIHYFRRVSSARAEKYLQSMWAEMKAKGIKPDARLKDAYEKKLKELQQSD